MEGGLFHESLAELEGGDPEVRFYDRGHVGAARGVEVLDVPVGDSRVPDNGGATDPVK